MSESKGGLPVRDLIAENFGIVIAYVVPGLAALVAVFNWDRGMREWIVKIAGEDASVGGFLILSVLSLGLGMVVQALRFSLFEQLLPRVGWCVRLYPALKTRPAYKDESRRSPEVRAALQQITDQHYRYYQCHGGLFIALIAALATWCIKDYSVSAWSKLMMWAFLAVIEVSLFSAAIDAYCRTRDRQSRILDFKEAA